MSEVLGYFFAKTIQKQKIESDSNPIIDICLWTITTNHD